jgi:hypothetical protein
MNEHDASIGALLRLAGERDAPSDAGVERARSAALAAWRQGLEPVSASSMPRRSRRIAAWAAAAAVAALTIGGAWHWHASRPGIAARIAAVGGDVRLDATGIEPLAAGREVLDGTTIDSRSGRIALAFGASSLRVDRATRVRIDSPDRVTLFAGEVYVDSGGLNATSPLRIATPAGEVRHVGTQFRVHVGGGVTSVHVREGRVNLRDAGGRTHEVATGERLAVDAGRAALSRGDDSFGAGWEWAAQIRPPFDIENRPLAEFLAWIAREHGWQLTYRDAAVQSRAREVRLHGSLDGLDAPGMIERVSLITGLPVELRDGTLVVEAGR